MNMDEARKKAEEMLPCCFTNCFTNTADKAREIHHESCPAFYRDTVATTLLELAQGEYERGRAVGLEEAARSCEEGESPDNDFGATCFACATDIRALISTAPAEQSPWKPIDTCPNDGLAFLGYGAAMEQPDFNPEGIIEATYNGEEMLGAVWCGEHDEWHTNNVKGLLTHWMPRPPAPPVAGDETKEK